MKKKLILIAFLAAGVLVVYAPLVSSFLRKKSKEVSEDVPTGGSEGDLFSKKAWGINPGLSGPDDGVLDGGKSSDPEEPTSGRKEGASHARLPARGVELFGIRETDPVVETAPDEPANGKGLPVLTGILDFGGTRMAVLDGKLLRHGDTIKGYRVEEIRSWGVVLRSKGGRGFLRFPEGDADKGD